MRLEYDDNKGNFFFWCKNNLVSLIYSYVGNLSQSENYLIELLPNILFEYKYIYKVLIKIMDKNQKFCIDNLLMAF